MILLKKKFASIISILSFSLVISTEVYSSDMKTNLFGEWKCNSITKIEDGIIYENANSEFTKDGILIFEGKIIFYFNDKKPLNYDSFGKYSWNISKNNINLKLKNLETQKTGYHGSHSFDLNKMIPSGSKAEFEIINLTNEVFVAGDKETMTYCFKFKDD